MRCGSCNQVFDGNAALLEPPAPSLLAPVPVLPLPEAVPFDQRMAALDTRAAEVLSVQEAEPVLELDSLIEQPDEPDAQDAPAETAQPFEPAAPAPTAPVTPSWPFPPADANATAPVHSDALFDLDLDIESEPDLEASSEPELSPAPAGESLDEVLNVDDMSDEQLEAALEAELEAMEQTLADAPHDLDTDAASYAGMSGDRVEPTWEDAPLDEPQAGAGPRLDLALAAADAAIFGDETPASEDDQADQEIHDIDDNIETVEPLPPRSLPDAELEEVDEEALVHLSSSGLAEAQATRAHAFLRAQEPEPEPEEDEDEPEEPGFVKRDRQRQKYGKAATIAMSAGSLLLVGALLLQAVTTFRNTLAANLPALKPALTAACQSIGCKIELPTQIDDLTIEQGELQTLSETTFSFTTLLRNQSASAQAWPSIELVLDDDKDKRLLRRVFSPHDYLPADAAADKGFAPHTEQAVKLYFELRDLKASGYHIAVFYP